MGFFINLSAALASLGCAEADVMVSRDRDAETARRYLAAGVNGDADGKFNLALMYLMGKGVSQDYDQSLRWMLEAAVTSHPSASRALSCLKTGKPSVNLGPAPRTFEDRPTDTPQLKLNAGLYYWLRSCDPVDSAKAVELLSAAAAADLSNAQYMMGVAFRQGRGVSRSDSESAKWFRHAGAQGHAAARRTFCDLNRAGNLAGPENESRTNDWCGAN
jgi:hypothetical protein